MKLRLEPPGLVEEGLEEEEPLDGDRGAEPQQVEAPKLMAGIKVASTPGEPAVFV